MIEDGEKLSAVGDGVEMGVVVVEVPVVTTGVEEESMMFKGGAEALGPPVADASKTRLVCEVPAVVSTIIDAPPLIPAALATVRGSESPRFARWLGRSWATMMDLDKGGDEKKSGLVCRIKEWKAP